MKLENLTKKEKDLLNKISNKEPIKFDDYFSVAKTFAKKYKNNEKYDEETNKLIYSVYKIYHLYKDNVNLKGTKYFKKYITFNTQK